MFACRIYMYTKVGHMLLMVFVWKTVFMRFEGARKLWYVFLSMLLKLANLLPIRASS